MRMKILSRRSCRARTARPSPFRTVPPRIEMLESRVVPSTLDYSLGFANPSGLNATGSATFAAIGDRTVAQLTNGGANQTGSILTNDTFSTSQFHTSFTFVPAAGQTTPTGGEFDFILQSGNNSVGIYFALNLQDVPLSLTGVTVNGHDSPPQILSNYGIDLHSQDPMNVVVDYNGSQLTWTVQDVTTGVTSPTFSAFIDIPSLLGNAAQVGFTGTTGTSSSVLYVQSWQGSFTPAVASPVPTLTSLSATSAAQGTGGLILTLNGSNFSTLSTVQWNGTSLPTVFLNSNQLLAVVPGSLMTQPGTASVTVLEPGVGSSQAQTFTIIATSSPTPSLSGLNVTSALAGTNGLTLTLNGSNFSLNSIVQWNGTSLTTSFVNGNQLTAIVPANLLAQPGTALVTVFTPGVGTSQAGTFTIMAPTAPTLGSLNVTSAPAGTNGLTLTLNGANFSSNSIVQWNGTSLTTSFVNGNQLTAVIPADLLAQAGTASISVSTPGVGSSQAESFTITANSSAMPSISSMSQTSATAGSGDMTVTINGSNFSPHSLVLFNHTSLSTSFVNGNQLTAVIPADLLAQAGTASISVSTPGVGSSQTESFTITPPPGGGASGMGLAGPLGQDIFTAMNPVEASPAQALLFVSSASSQAGQAASADSYWRLLSRSSGDRIMDPNGWAVHELTLALEGK